MEVRSNVSISARLVCHQGIAMLIARNRSERTAEEKLEPQCCRVEKLVVCNILFHNIWSMLVSFAR